MSAGYSRVRSGSVVQCLTRDRGAAALSLTGVTALFPWARHINPRLVLVQPRKTHPYITEILLKGCRELNQTNKLPATPELICVIPAEAVGKLPDTVTCFSGLKLNIWCESSAGRSGWFTWTYEFMKKPHNLLKFLSSGSWGISQGHLSKIFEHKIAIIFLSISLNMCCWWSKELSHQDGSFEYPQPMFRLRNKNWFSVTHCLSGGLGFYGDPESTTSYFSAAYLLNQWVDFDQNDQEIPQSQTADTPRYREEEPLNHHETPGRQIKQSNQPPLPHQDDCNTRTDIK